MTDDDKRLHELNTAWGRGYLSGMFAPLGRQEPPWAPGATGDQWVRAFYHAKFEVVVHGARDERA